MKCVKGVRSVLRNYLHPEIQLKSYTKCYRATIQHDQMRDDPELSPLFDSINFWMGPDRLIIASNMEDTKTYTMNLYHSGDTGDAGDWKAPGDLNHMRSVFNDFNPQIQKLLGLVESCILWKVVAVPELESWMSPHGKMVLIGDAAHAMVSVQGQVCILYPY